MKGKIISGVGKAAQFTRLEWVQDQCERRLGFRPYPGTLNLEIAQKEIALLEALFAAQGIRLIPPDPEFCEARTIPVVVGDIGGALILPDEKVRIHGRAIIELLAPVKVREILQVNDGDFLQVRIPDRDRSGGQTSRSVGLKETGMEVDAVLFDLDGTLIDTLDIYCRVLNIALERLGFQPADKEVIVSAAKEGEFEWNRVLPREPGIPVDEVIQGLREIIGDLYKDALHEEAELIPGTSEILRKISGMGLKMALVTSTPRRYLMIKLDPLRRAGVDGLFDLFITSDDAFKKKPAPDPLIVCAEKLGVSPGRSVYVGDSRVDIRAGKAAGMKTAGVLTGMEDRESLERERPDAIIDSVAALPDLIRKN